MPAKSKVAALRAASRQVLVTGAGPYVIHGPAHCAPAGIEGEAITTSYHEAMRTAARWRALVALDVLGKLTPKARKAIDASSETTAHKLLDLGMGAGDAGP